MAGDSFSDFAAKYGYTREEIDHIMQQNPDLNAGAPAGVRAGASFQGNPKDKLSYVKERLGAENVTSTPSGEILWRRPGEIKWNAFDERGLSWADIADFAGDAPELIGGIAGGLGGNVLGAVGGSVAGNVVKQAAAEGMRDTPSTETLGSRAKDVGVAGVLGGVGQKVGNVVGGWLKGGRASAADDAAYKAESERLTQSVGTAEQPARLTGAQRSGDRNARIVEDQIRRNAFGGKTFEKFELEEQVRPLYARLNRIMDDLAQPGVDDAQLGSILKDTFTRTVEKLRGVTQAQAKTDAQFIDELVGRTPSIPVEKFTAELKMLAKFDQPLEGFAPEVQKMAKFARKTLENLEVSNGGKLTADQMQSWMHNLSLASKGKGRIADALSPDADRRLAAQLIESLDNDLNAAADGVSTMVVPQGVRADNAAKLLRTFRDNYRANAQAIDELGNTVLARRFGGKIPPESIGKSAEWLRNLRPDEIAKSMELLEVNRPGIRELTMRNLMEDAIAAAERKANIQKDQYGRIPLSMDDLRLSLPDDKKIKAILGNNHVSATDLADVLGYLNRATARTLSTMSNQETWVKTVTSALKNPNIHSLSAFAPRLAAEAATDPAAFRWLRVLAQTAGTGGAVARRAGEEFSRWALPRIAQEAGISARDQ